MHVNRMMTNVFVGSMISIVFATPSWGNPKQYRSGYATGAAHGKEMGRMDGSGEAGTNAMHTMATCRIEHPKSKDFDRGYDRGCRITYQKTFEQAYKNRKKKK
jgi:hypothetical protein